MYETGVGDYNLCPAVRRRSNVDAARPMTKRAYFQSPAATRAMYSSVLRPQNLDFLASQRAQHMEGAAIAKQSSLRNEQTGSRSLKPIVKNGADDTRSSRVSYLRRVMKRGVCHQMGARCSRARKSDASFLPVTNTVWQFSQKHTAYIEKQAMSPPWLLPVCPPTREKTEPATRVLRS